MEFKGVKIILVGFRDVLARAESVFSGLQYGFVTDVYDFCYSAVAAEACL